MEVHRKEKRARRRTKARTRTMGTRFFHSLVLRGVWSARKRRKLNIDANPVTDGAASGGIVIRRGTRSIKDAEVWTCTDCNSVNFPTRHILIDLPAFCCHKCGKKCDVEFDFSFKNLTINDVCLVVHVKNQGDTDFCCPFAITAATEITHRMMKVLLGTAPTSMSGPLLDPLDLQMKYVTCLHGPEEAKVQFHKTTVRMDLIPDMVQLVVTEGIERKDAIGVCKIPGTAVIMKDNFSAIAKALADGHALVAGFWPGKNYEELEYGEIYKAPRIMDLTMEEWETKDLTMHVVVLIGAGRRRKTNYFHFLSSHGSDFCCPYDEEGKMVVDAEGECLGGVGKVRAEDLLFDPLQLLRFSEPYKEVERKKGKEIQGNISEQWK